MSKFKATQATVPKAVVLLASESRRGGVTHTKVPGRQNSLVDKGQSTTLCLSPRTSASEQPHISCPGCRGHLHKGPWTSLKAETLKKGFVYVKPNTILSPQP